MLHGIKKILILATLLTSHTSFASVTINGYLYNYEPNAKVHFATPYPNNVKALSTVPYNKLSPLVVDTTGLEPNTTLFTLSDDKGNECGVGVTSTTMSTQFEIIYSTSDNFCVAADKPNYLVSIMPPVGA